jgi:hypothetical protein
MKARIRKGILIIRIALINPPTPSKSGKRLLVANSRGYCRTSAKVGKKPVAANVIATIHKDEQQDKQKKPGISKSKSLHKGAKKR